MNIPKYLKTLSSVQLQNVYKQAIDCQVAKHGEKYRARIIEENEWDAKTQYSRYTQDIRRVWAALNSTRTVNMTDEQADEWDAMVKGWAG